VRAALYDGEEVAGELEIRADALCIIGISLRQIMHYRSRDHWVGVDV